MIRYEGVTFIKDACLQMTRAKFIDAHVGIFWPGHDEKTQRKMLGEAYDLMAPTAKKK